MKLRFIIIALILWLLPIGVAAGPFVEMHLTGIYADDGAGELCDNKWRPSEYGDYAYWQNNTNRNIFVHYIETFMGVSYGYRGDLSVALELRTNGYAENLDSKAWDHYAEPTGPHELLTDFRPGVKTVRPGDSLVLYRKCSADFFNPLTFKGEPKVSKTTAKVHFSYEQP